MNRVPSLYYLRGVSRDDVISGVSRLHAQAQTPSPTRPDPFAHALRTATRR